MKTKVPAWMKKSPIKKYSSRVGKKTGIYYLSSDSRKGDGKKFDALIVQANIDGSQVVVKLELFGGVHEPMDFPNALWFAGHGDVMVYRERK